MNHLYRILEVVFYMAFAVLFTVNAQTALALDSASGDQPAFKTTRPNQVQVRLKAIAPDGKSSVTGPVTYAGSCPATITFKGVITSPRAGDVSYTFTRSDGGKMKEMKVHFNKPGEKAVQTSWKLGKSYSGWQSLDLINQAEGKSSAKAEFSLECSIADLQTNRGKGKEGVRALKNQSPVDEECTSFNPNVSIFQEDTRTKRLNFYDTEKDPELKKPVFSQNRTFAPFAEQALNLIRGYGFNQICYSKPRGYMRPYFLVSGAAPTGQQPGEKCTPFNPAGLVTRSWSNVWQVYDGKQVVVQYDRSEEAALNGIAILKKYGFTQSCSFGDVSPSLLYYK